VCLSLGCSFFSSALKSMTGGGEWTLRRKLTSQLATNRVEASLKGELPSASHCANVVQFILAIVRGDNPRALGAFA